MDHIAQVAGFIQMACGLPAAIRAAQEREADGPLAFGRPSNGMARSLERVHDVLEQGRGVLDPNLNAALQLAWSVPAALNEVNGASQEVTALIQEVDTFSRTLLRQKEILEAQRARIEPGFVRGVARVLSVGQDVLRSVEQQASTFSSLTGTGIEYGPFRTRDDGRRQIDYWRESLGDHKHNMQAYLTEIERNSSTHSLQDDQMDADVNGFQFPFTFRNQHVLIKVPSLTACARGASGTVVRALIDAGDTVERVVLKVPHHLCPTADQEILKRELDIWGRIDNARILPYYGTCKIPYGQSAFVSPYMENGNLCQYLRANPTADRRILIRQVAEGLQYLHDVAGIVHGDMKCENVLVSNDGAAVLADFGLSTLVDGGGSVTATTMRAHHTLRFAAPELVLDEAHDGVRKRSKTTFSDVYAYGMLVYQVYTGTPPWPGANDMQVIKFITSGVQPPRVQELDDSLWDLVQRCWHRDAPHRPTMRAILEELESRGLQKKNYRHRAENPNKPSEVPSLPQFASGKVPVHVIYLIL